jgi:hypothetical protein
MTATATTGVATAWALLHAALVDRRPVEVAYHGRRRLICPHALGFHNARPIVLGYQTGGETSTGRLPSDPRKRWRCMYLDEVEDVVVAAPTSPWGTADNYNPLRPFALVADVAIAVTDGTSPAGG